MTYRQLLRRPVTGLFVLLAACKGATQEMPTETVADVRAIIAADNAKFVAHVAAGHADSVAQLYHDDAMLLLGGAEPVSGKTAIKAEFDRLLAADVRLALTIADVSLADSIAVERGTYTLAVRDKADTARQLSAEAGNYLVEWRKRDGIWKLHWDVTAPVPPPAAPDSATSAN